MSKKPRGKRSAKNVLRLPDLDHSKTSVLQSLGSVASKRTYALAIDDFITWYCSEPRLAFARTVVLRYRYELEARRLAPATINLRLAAVRRLAYEASDNGLLSPDLAASIRRVKGAKKLGTRIGNWLTCTQGRRLLEAPDRRLTKGKRDHAILALLLGCGLRRAELIGLKLAHLQQRDDHWAIIDLFGKGGHVRTVPVPDWVKFAVDEWLTAARIVEGHIFRCVTHSGTIWGSGISEKVVWWVVRQSSKKAAIEKVAPHDLRRTCARLCHSAGGELEQIQFLLGHRSKGILDLGSGSCTLSMTSWASSRMRRQAEEFTAKATLQAFRDYFRLAVIRPQRRTGRSKRRASMQLATANTHGHTANLSVSAVISSSWPKGLLQARDDEEDLGNAGRKRPGVAAPRGVK